MPFTEEWLPSGHSTIKAWLVECYRDGCPSRRFSHLHRGILKLCESDYQVLGHLSALGIVLVVPNLFHLRLMEVTVFLGTFNAADIFWYSSPDLFLITVLSRSSMDNSFDFVTWFLHWYALATVGPYIDRCVPFQIISIQLNLPQVESNEVVETSQGCSMHLSSISKLIPKSLNTYLNKVFLFLLLINVQNNLKTCFCFVIMGYCV